MISQSIIEQYYQTVPLDIVGLARSIGLAVWESTLSNHKVSGVGLLKWDERHGGELGYSLIIDKSMSIQAMRLAVAQLVAHVILHEEQLDDCLVLQTNGQTRLTDEENQHALEFAMNLLIPTQLLTIGRKVGKTPIELAEIFNVPVAMIESRLQ